MWFSINCTNRKWVSKINSSIQGNKNISSTLCLSMERNWACLLQFYYRSSEGQPLDSSDPCILSKGQRTRSVWSSTCCEPIMWILFLQIFAKLWIESYVKGRKNAQGAIGKSARNRQIPLSTTDQSSQYYLPQYDYTCNRSAVGSRTDVCCLHVL